MSFRQCDGCWRYHPTHMECPYCAGMSTAHPATMMQVVDEAAIRADERASAAAWIESMTFDASSGSLFLHVLRRIARDIRAGKHRSTP